MCNGLILPIKLYCCERVVQPNTIKCCLEAPVLNSQSINNYKNSLVSELKLLSVPRCRKYRELLPQAFINQRYLLCIIIMPYLVLYCCGSCNFGTLSPKIILPNPVRRTMYKCAAFLQYTLIYMNVAR